VVDLDVLNAEEQDVLLWVAETETGLSEPIPVSIAHLSTPQLNVTVERLIQVGLLRREFPWLGPEHSNRYGLSVELTNWGAEAVVLLWRRRLRATAQIRLIA